MSGGGISLFVRSIGAMVPTTVLADPWDGNLLSWLATASGYPRIKYIVGLACFVAIVVMARQILIFARTDKWMFGLVLGVYGLILYCFFANGSFTPTDGPQTIMAALVGISLLAAAGSWASKSEVPATKSTKTRAA